MRDIDKHPDRVDMVRAIRTGNIPFSSHLNDCETCRSLFTLFSRYAQIERPPRPDLSVLDQSTHIINPPRDSVYRHMAIARLDQSRNPAKTTHGTIAYDSWANLPAVQVRAADFTGERRLRLKADRFTLEFIAEKQLDQWEFVARVYDCNKVTSQFILQLGRKKLYSMSQRCFFWSAKNPPKRVQLLSPTLKIDFGELTW